MIRKAQSYAHVNADLRGAKFDGANLKGAYFDGSILEGVDLSGALNVDTAHLENAKKPPAYMPLPGTSSRTYDRGSCARNRQYWDMP
jgi:hypothetical protein